MSHFSVLVVGPNIDLQLASFNEQPETGDPYVKLQFVDTTDEYRQQYEEGSTTWVRCEDGTLVLPWDKRFRDEKDAFARCEAPPELERVEVPFKERFATFEEYVKFWHGDEQPNEQGRYGYFNNPQAKWDWYQLGGRWSGMLILKKGSTGELGSPGVLGGKHPNDGADRALKRDIDFDRMRNEAGQRASVLWDRVHAITGPLDDFATWERVCDELYPGDIEAARTYYHAQPAREAIKAAAKDEQNTDLVWIELDEFIVSRAEFVEHARRHAISTYAVLKDGQWYQRGDMGWFGMSSNEKPEDDWDKEFEALLNSLPDDTMLSIVDCHI